MGVDDSGKEVLMADAGGRGCCSWILIIGFGIALGLWLFGALG
jgi:hypothetical protein